MKCRCDLIGFDTLTWHWWLIYGQPSPEDLIRALLASPGVKLVLEVERAKYSDLSLKPCMSFIPYALVFWVHWTPMEVEV